MLLVDFAAKLLKAHGRTLIELDDLMDRDSLIAMLTFACEKSDTEMNPSLDSIFETTLPTAVGETLSDPYQMLNQLVYSLGLSSEIEDLIWAYPPYRALIESSLSLNLTLSAELALPLIDELIRRSTQFAKHCASSGTIEELKLQSISDLACRKFKLECLASLGLAPLKVVTT